MTSATEPSATDPRSVRPAAPARVAVVGGGRMGSGIAHAFVTSGSAVTLIEMDDGRAAAARCHVAAAVDASVARGSVTEPAATIMARLTVGTAIAAAAGADLAIEAVPESVDLKAPVLRALGEAVGPGGLVASNTSSLPIDRLADAVAEPGRFCGMHFFNPVPASQLVEVVVGARTDTDTAERARGVVAALGKVAITVSDSPGFASSRLGLVLGLEAIRMLESHVAEAADIDTAMTLGYRHPIGPLRLTDLVGLDVRLAIAEHLAATLGPRFEPPALLHAMVARGDLGRKTGRGFYDWT